MCVLYSLERPQGCFSEPHWEGIPSIHKAHKHVLQEVFVLQYQSKDWVYFVYVFQICVQIFMRPFNLYIRYFPHHWDDTTQPIVHKAHKHVLLEVFCATISK